MEKVEKSELKIPKKLHYVWVGGGKMSDLMNECMATWKVHCPDYEVIEWNEKNFDIEGNPWAKAALAARNWALVSDIMRAWILYEHGGIYVDTDIEILRPLDEFLANEFFMGYESKHWCNTAIIGSVACNEIVGKCIERYKKTAEKGTKIESNTNLLAVQAYSAIMEMEYGIKPNGQTSIYENGVGLYSRDYFYPQDWLTHKIKLTQNSAVVHRCSQTWLTKGQRRMFKFFKAVRRVIGKPIFSGFEGVAARGYRKTIRKELGWKKQKGQEKVKKK